MGWGYCEGVLHEKTKDFKKIFYEKYNVILGINSERTIFNVSPKTLFSMNRIKEVLEERGIKQVWLAEKLGKSFNTVNGYVQNRNQPSLEVLYEVARILNVDVTELLKSNKN